MAIKKVMLPQDPVPEKEISFHIPIDLLKLFERAPRIVIKNHGMVCIPAPDVLLKAGALKETLKEFDVVLVPKEFMK